jgi:hypothetical protein
MKSLKIFFIIFALIKVNLSIEHCSEPTGKDYCISCENNYGLTTDGTCVQCTENTVYMNNHCFSKIEKCSVYLLYVEGEKCEKCEEGYELNEEKTKCTKCTGDNISSNGEKCHEKINQCEEYSDEYDDGVHCRQCSEGYNKVQDSTKCTESCGNGKVRPFTDCITEIEHCLIYNENGSCKKCDSEFYDYDDENEYSLQLKDNQCVRCPSGYKSNGINCYLPHFVCEDHDDSGNCAYCYDGYKVSSGSCVKNGGGMNIYNSFNFKINIIFLLLIILL